MTKTRIGFAEAIACIGHAVTPGVSEMVPVIEANARITYSAAVVGRNCPPFDMSAMDGYAIAFEDLAGARERHLRLCAPQFAGMPATILKPGEARQISTGAIIPRGAGAILVQESACLRAGSLVLADNLSEGANIRRTGEDARMGDTVLGAGIRLNPAMIGALGGFGVEAVQVHKRPHLALIIVGDELATAQAPTASQVIDVNGPMLSTLFLEAGCDLVSHVTVLDDEGAINRALDAALSRQVDFIVTAGGASVGERDLLRTAVERTGAAIHFHGVHMRPGKPCLFATLDPGCAIFALPGNPVAALVAARFFVMTAIRARLGLGIETACRTLPGEALPGPTRVLKALANGEEVTVLPGQQSHMMHPFLTANVWLVQGGDRPASLYSLMARVGNDMIGLTSPIAAG